MAEWDFDTWVLMRVCLHSMSRRKNDCNSRFHTWEILFLVACELEVGIDISIQSSASRWGQGEMALQNIDTRFLRELHIALTASVAMYLRADNENGVKSWTSATEWCRSQVRLTEEEYSELPYQTSWTLKQKDWKSTIWPHMIEDSVLNCGIARQNGQSGNLSG